MRLPNGKQGPGSVPESSLDGVGKRQHTQATKQAAKFFSQLGRFALDSGIAVDILAVGLAAVNIGLLSKVATDSGGFLSMHQGKHLGPPAGEREKIITLALAHLFKPLLPSPILWAFMSEASGSL